MAGACFVETIAKSPSFEDADVYVYGGDVRKGFRGEGVIVRARPRLQEEKRHCDAWAQYIVVAE